MPERISEGIRLEHVSFTYPGTERRVLEDVCLDLKPGAGGAIVGENGAGKSTLVKLLCRMYQPTSGGILVDGLELARMPADAWRSRLAGAFQDFFRFELRARQTVGIGDVPRLDDEPAVVAAVNDSVRFIPPVPVAECLDFYSAPQVVFGDVHVNMPMVMRPSPTKKPAAEIQMIESSRARPRHRVARSCRPGTRTGSGRRSRRPGTGSPSY